MCSSGFSNCNSSFIAGGRSCCLSPECHNSSVVFADEDSFVELRNATMFGGPLHVPSTLCILRLTLSFQIQWHEVAGSKTTTYSTLIAP
jgi:hypothetical protein